MSDLETVHAALTRTNRLLKEIQRVFDLPFCPREDCIILDGFEAINKISGEMEMLRARAEKAEAELEFARMANEELLSVRIANKAEIARLREALEKISVQDGGNRNPFDPRWPGNIARAALSNSGGDRE